MLEELLKPFAKESDNTIHLQMKSLIKRFDEDTSTYDEIMNRAIRLYSFEYDKDPMYKTVINCYELARDL